MIFPLPRSIRRQPDHTLRSLSSTPSTPSTPSGGEGQGEQANYQSIQRETRNHPLTFYVSRFTFHPPTRNEIRWINSFPKLF